MTTLPIDLALAAITTENTRVAYAHKLRLFARWLEDTDPPPAFSRDTIILFLDNLRSAHRAERGRPYSPQYYATALAALKRLAKHMAESGELDYMGYLAIRAIESPKVKRVTQGELVDEDMLKRLLKACLTHPTAIDTPPGPMGTRDAAIIALLSATGMRRAELAALDIEHYNERSKSLLIQEAKNHEDRLAYLNPGAAQYLDDWLKTLGDDTGPIFRVIRLYPTKKDRPQAIASKRLSAMAIYKIVSNRALQAGLEESITTHDFRKSFVSGLLNTDGVDPMAIARLTGHQSIETIRLYDLTVDNRAKKAAQGIHTPYLAGE